MKKIIEPAVVQSPTSKKINDIVGDEYLISDAHTVGGTETYFVSSRELRKLLFTYTPSAWFFKVSRFNTDIPRDEEKVVSAIKLVRSGKL